MKPPLRFGGTFRLAPGPSVVLTLHVRTNAAPEGLLGHLRGEVLAIDPRVAIFDVQTMEQHLRDSLVANPPRSDLA